MACAWPVLAAAVASWIAGAVWYGLLADRWIAALETTKDALMGPSGRPSAVPYAISFVAEIVMAAALLFFLLRPGPPSAAGGMVLGGLVWLGFVGATLLVNNVYAKRRPDLTVIDAGHWLAVLLIQGAVLGAMA